MRKPPNLRKATTSDLFNELLTRSEVLHCTTGPYRPYEIRPKYGAKPLTEDNAPLSVIAIHEDALDGQDEWLNPFPEIRDDTDVWAQRADVLWGTVRRWMVNRVYTPEEIRAFYERQYGCKEGADRRIVLMVRLFQDYLAAFAPESDAAPAGNASE